MNKKFNLRGKTFILFVIFYLILNFNILLYAILSLQIPVYARDIIIYLLLYSISIVMLFINTNKSRKIAWILALIPSLMILFNPFKSPTNPYLSMGRLVSLFQSAMGGDTVTALLMIVASLIPILIIIYSISELINYNNKKFDLVLGWMFIIFFCFELFGFSIITGSIYFANILKPMIISILYITTILIWTKLSSSVDLS